MFLSDSGKEIPDSFYSSGWNSLSNSQNTHGFLSTPNSVISNFSLNKAQDTSKLFFDSSTQTNFVPSSLLPLPKLPPPKTSDLDIMNSNTVRMPWPTGSTYLADNPGTTEDKTISLDEIPAETSIMDNINLPEFNSVTGMVAGTLNNSIMGSLNQQNYTKTMQGNSPLQGDFNSQRTAQLTLDNRNIASSVGSTIMSASSLLGPEAFAAGTVIGAGIDIATEEGAFDSTPAPVNTN